MAQPHKPAKHLHPADLPDPLSDSQDVPMASADDLLSEIVGDDVERLMSGEFDPIVPTARRPVEQIQQQLGNFLEEVRRRERQAPPASPQGPRARPASHVPLTPRSAPPAPPAPLAPPVQPSYRLEHDEDVAPLDDLVGPTREELIGPHSGEYEPSAVSAAVRARGPAESRALLAPVDVHDGEPVYLKPLDWIGAPIAALSARGRVAVSLLAVCSFLGGCAALGYVLLLRHGMT